MKQPNIKTYYLSLLLVLLMLASLIPIVAATTADVVITVTLANVSISDNQTSYGFGIVQPGSTSNTTTSQVAITNTSTVQTDMTISVTSANWTGGTQWIHSDTATPGVDTAGLKAGRSTVADVVVKYAATHNYIYENCPASTNYTYGFQLLAPTSTAESPATEKTITIRVSASQG